jgi:mannitol-specific phosphotransferase system IIBC component
MNHDIRSGTFGGTLLTVVMTIEKEDIWKTMILTAIGAAVSFCISILLKQCIGIIKGR